MPIADSPIAFSPIAGSGLHLLTSEGTSGSDLSGWASPFFQLGSVVIEVPQAIQLTQTYQEFGGAGTLRSIAGRAIRQFGWRKLRTTISGQGMLPPGLATLDWEKPHKLRCAGLLGFTSLSPSNIALRYTPRPDVPVDYRALVSGMWLHAQGSIADNLATITPVDNATAYMVAFRPYLTVFANPPETSVDRTAGTFNWTVEAEQA